AFVEAQSASKGGAVLEHPVAEHRQLAHARAHRLHPRLPRGYQPRKKKPWRRELKRIAVSVGRYRALRSRALPALDSRVRLRTLGPLRYLRGASPQAAAADSARGSRCTAGPGGIDAQGARQAVVPPLALVRRRGPAERGPRNRASLEYPCPARRARALI